MPTNKERAKRRERHALEVEVSQEELRKSIAATKNLVEQSDAMLLRHRKECEEGDASANGATGSTGVG